jgi:predicted aspartyl protease
MSSSAARREKAAKKKAEKKLAREAGNLAFEFDFDPNILTFFGPRITTDITITEDHRAALAAAGQPIPRPVPCRFLIDTGADTTVVKHEIATRAGLKLINANHPLHGVGVDTTGKAYLGRVMFGKQSQVVSAAMHHVFVDTQVVSSDLKTDQIDGLIGRDVLQHFTMTYNGKTGRVSIKYHKHA